MHSCKTKYPTLMLHGVGVRDGGTGCWGRIPAALRARGARVVFGGQDAWGTIEENARVLQKMVLRVLRRTRAERVNLLAHSKGGLDARYLISTLGMEAQIASLTTISTPHHGSSVADWIYSTWPDAGRRIIARGADWFYRRLGDLTPDILAAGRQLTSDYVAQFNRSNPDRPQVFYQSCAGVISSPVQEPLLTVPFLILQKTEGANDGLVSIRSARWGTFAGVWHGMSHYDEVDLRRRMRGRWKRAGGPDVVTLYCRLLARLAAHGC